MMHIEVSGQSPDRMPCRSGRLMRAARSDDLKICHVFGAFSFDLIFVSDGRLSDPSNDFNIEFNIQCR